VQLFHRLNRSGYPSAYVYSTGQWHKYRDLLVLCFQLSENGRLSACNALISFGLDSISENPFFGRSEPRIRLFEDIVDNYSRVDSNENGGLVFQAIAYGYIAADRPHLSIIADKVRTGSSRQKRFGDVDCYMGLDLELSVEVKDLEIGSENVERELGGFATEVKSNRIRGLAFVKSIADGVKTKLFDDYGILSMTELDLLRIVESWDWPKQDLAVQGILHYLSHIEQNPEASVRLLRFIAERDEGHDSLCYLETT
jgi:hypothetical protein